MSHFQPGPFDVSADDLSRVSPSIAVSLVHQLLVAEAQQIGVPITAVNVPSTIYVADGGVDAEVSLVSVSTMPLGLLREGHTRYQIKSGSFSASNISELKQLIFLPSKKGQPDQLNHRVKACLDANGTFVVLLFGAEATGTSEGYGENELKQLLIDAGYAAPNVEIIRSNQIAASIKVLAPALALQINGIISPDGAPLYWLEHLRDSSGLELNRFITTAQRTSQIDAMTELANALDGFNHVRMIGDPGAGKTHLAYAAVKDSLSKGLVLYTDAPEKMLETSLISRLIQASKNARIILIADDCDLATAMSLEEKFKNVAGHFLLISIFNQSGKDQILDAVIIDLMSLDIVAMKAIFASYGIPEDGQAWLSELCQGSPRAAHIIGKLISRNPEVDYAEHFPALDEVWEGFVTSPHKRGSSEGNAKLTVARCIALFKRLGWEGSFEELGRSSLDQAITLVSSLDAATVSNAIQELRRGRILQGNTVLFITPKLLHIKLWCDWWDAFEHKVTDEWLKTAFEGKMREWFNEMFAYAHESKAARRVVTKMLSPEGQFSQLKFFSEPGQAQLFFALAQAEPKAALRRLKCALDNANSEQILAFKNGRREIIHGLERLAIPKSNFISAADSLRILAEAENESWSNNATGVFVSLFTLGYGALAASEISPIEKIPYLRNLLKSDSPDSRKLAIRALVESLDAFMSRTDIGNTAGLRHLPERWTPVSWDELTEAYKAHINLLLEVIPNLSANEKVLAAKGIIGNARSLLASAPLAELVLSSLRAFIRLPALKRHVTAAVEAALHYDKNGLPAGVVKELESLQFELTEKSFHDKLVRYVGLQLTEDSFDEKGQYREGPHPALISLRDQAVKEPNLLEQELDWLLTDAAKNGFLFGELLGLELKLALWPLIKVKWLSLNHLIRNDFFIGGYLSGLFKQDQDAWQNEIFQLLDMQSLSNETLVLVWRSGMTDLIAHALLRECRAGRIDARKFGILIYGARVKDLPLEVFNGIVNILLSSDNIVDADTALDLVQSRRRANSDEAKFTLELLQSTISHEAFVVGSSSKINNNMREYHWTEAAEELLQERPQEALALGVRCVNHFGAEGSVTSSFYSGSLKFFDQLLVKFPNEMWEVISRILDEKLTSSAYHLLQWLRGRRNEELRVVASGFEVLNPKIVLDWVDKKPDSRAPLIARYCPPLINPVSQGPATLARSILERYGQIERVGSSMQSNFMTAFFSGLASEYYQRRLDAVRELLSIETNQNVRCWLEAESEYLVHTVEQEKAREEAREY